MGGNTFGIDSHGAKFPKHERFTILAQTNLEKDGFPGIKITDEANQKKDRKTEKNTDASKSEIEEAYQRMIHATETEEGA